MTEETLSDIIQSQINNTVNSIPRATRCTIRKIYEDNIHTDVETNEGIVRYVETIGNNLAIGNTGVLIYLDLNHSEYLVITK